MNVSNDQLPPPFIPPQVDLRDFTFMPLDVRRLRDSRLMAVCKPEEIVAAVMLWCASWHQRPAASLPDDDVELAQLAGYGRAVSQFKRVKAGALYGLVLCSDGRWYHPVVAEKAVEAWNEKLDHAYRREYDRVRKENSQRKEAGQELLELPSRPERISVGIPMEFQWNGDGIPGTSGTEFECKGTGTGTGTGKGQGQRKESGAGAPFSLDNFPNVDPVLWTEFEAHRKEIRKPLTDRARKAAAGILNTLSADDQREAVTNTVASRWTGIFPPKKKPNGAASGYTIKGKTYHLPPVGDDRAMNALCQELGINVLGLDRWRAHEKVKGALERLELRQGQ
jgi:hypothetical protein